MFILDYRKCCIHNSDFIQRFTISPKPDGVFLVCAAVDSVTPLFTLGRYSNEKDAAGVLSALFAALGGGAAYFDMPLQGDLNEEERKRDARTKRKGGS